MFFLFLINHVKVFLFLNIYLINVMCIRSSKEIGDGCSSVGWSVGIGARGPQGSIPVPY
jgi:hypothetical protein